MSVECQPHGSILDLTVADQMNVNLDSVNQLFALLATCSTA
jgi:hypothetical protein